MLTTKQNGPRLTTEGLTNRSALGRVIKLATSSVPTSVYRFYDKNGLLLYVGITSRGVTRQREHNATKDWWPYVSTQEVEHFPSRAHAEDRERGLIRRHQPPFNATHNPGYPAGRDAYLDLIAGPRGEVRDAVQAVFSGSGGKRIPLSVAVTGTRLTLRAEPEPILSALDCHSVYSAQTVFYGNRAVKPKATRAHVDHDGLVIEVLCRVSPQPVAAVAVLRMPSGTSTHVTFKRIDIANRDRLSALHLERVA